MPFAGDYGYSGGCKIGTAVAMLIPGSNMDRPLGEQVPQPVGNRYGGVNYSQGMRFPAVSLNAVLHASWFTAANLNAWFCTRGGAAPFDLTAIAGNLNFYESTLGKHKILSPKGAGFSLNFSAGQAILTMGMQFHGTALDTADAAPAFVNTAPLSYAEVSFGGSFSTVKIRSGSIQWNTGLTPLEDMNGSHYPSEHNAGIPNLSVNLQVYPETAVTIPGLTDDNTVTAVTDATLSVKIGVATYTTFSFTSLLLANPNAKSVQDPNQRVLRDLRYRGLATTAAYPMTISAT